MPPAADDDGLGHIAFQVYNVLGDSQPSLPRPQHVQNLINRFTIQLQHGCGTSVCTTPTCATTRSRLASRPVRRYTVLSARAMAITLAASEGAEIHLCPHIDPDSAPVSTDAQLKVDPKSVVQQLCNTVALRGFCAPHASTISSHKLAETTSFPPDESHGIESSHLVSTDSLEPLSCRVMALYKHYITTGRLSHEVSEQQLRANVLSILRKISSSLADFDILSRSFADNQAIKPRDSAMSTSYTPSVYLDDAFRNWTSTSQDMIFTSIRSALQPIFESPFARSSSPKSYLALPIQEKNIQVSTVVFTALHALTGSVPRAQRETWHVVWSTIVNGRAYGKQRFQRRNESNNPPWIRILDAFEHESALRMAKTLIRAIGARTCLEETLIASGNGKNRSDLFGWEFTEDKRLRRLLISKLVHEEQVVRKAKFKTVTRDESQHGKHMLGTTSLVWLEWLRKCFLKEWDGMYTINRWSVAGQALELMEDLWQNRAKHALDIPDDLFPTPIVFNFIEVDKAVQDWLKHKIDVNSRHLLSFKSLFSTRALTLFVRTAHHVLMRRAYGEADFFWQMRRRNLYQITYEDTAYLDRRLKAAQTHHLVLRINRHSLLSDAFDQLWHREKRELMRPLRIRMGMDEGEIGHDLGGVQIEFFKLVCQEAFRPEYSLFTIDPDTRLAWFKPASLVPLYKFQIFGLLFALAIWNGVTLPVSFPLAFYKKLLFLPCNESDFHEGWPSLTKSLKQLRMHEGSVEEDFARDYVYSFTANGLHVDVDMEDPWDGWSIWDKIKSGKGLAAGQMKIMHAYPDKHHPDRYPGSSIAQADKATTEQDSDLQQEADANAKEAKTEPVDSDVEGEASSALDSPNSDNPKAKEEAPKPSYSDPNQFHWPGWNARMVEGEEPITVTNENRQKYIQDYARWAMDFSIRPQFMSFAKGFYALMVHKPLTLMSPEQLRLLVEGHNHLDISALQRAATYQNYTSSSPTIRWFWEVVKSYPQEKQKKLLEFVTASSRVPVNGAESLTFVVENPHWGNDALPGSSTCFGTLRLPDYSSKETLREKLDIALEHSLGFGQA